MSQKSIGIGNILNNPILFIPQNPIHLKYIFPAGGLLKSTPNTFVKIKLRKAKLKNPCFSAL
jgi:hypothetical protein